MSAAPAELVNSCNLMAHLAVWASVIQQYYGTQMWASELS